MKNVKDRLENILSDEEICIDNMPDNLQGSIRGEESENAIDILSETVDELENIINSLREI